MKRSWMLLILILAILFVFTATCGDDDDDNDTVSGDDDTETDDDSADDDATDDDTADDDDGADDDSTDDDSSDDDSADDDSTDDDATDDDDDTTEEQLVLDDGTAEKGVTRGCMGCMVVQGFSPPETPATLVNVYYYVYGDIGLANKVRLVVFYSAGDDKGMPPSTIPVYCSDKFTVGSADSFNTIDLSTVPELLANPIYSEFWVGLEYTEEFTTGPDIGFDEDGTPDDNAWTWPNPWYPLTDDGDYGVLMWRPTVSY